jgi:hypothetical protein
LVREGVYCPPGLVLIILLVHGGWDRVVRPERDGVSSPEGGERRDEQSSVGLVVLLGDSATSSADAGLIDPEWSLGE